MPRSIASAERSSKRQTKVLIGDPPAKEPLPPEVSHLVPILHIVHNLGVVAGASDVGEPGLVLLQPEDLVHLDGIQEIRGMRGHEYLSPPQGVFAKLLRKCGQKFGVKLILRLLDA